MLQPTPTLISVLEANGWTVKCESPFEICHDETGSLATLLAAQIVAEDLQAGLAEAPEPGEARLLTPAAAFTALSMLSAQIARFTVAATALGPADPDSSEAHDTWETAHQLVFSATASGRVTELLKMLNCPAIEVATREGHEATAVREYQTRLQAQVGALVPFFV